MILFSSEIFVVLLLWLRHLLVTLLTAIVFNITTKHIWDNHSYSEYYVIWSSKMGWLLCHQNEIDSLVRLHEELHFSEKSVNIGLRQFDACCMN